MGYLRTQDHANTTGSIVRLHFVMNNWLLVKMECLKWFFIHSGIFTKKASFDAFIHAFYCGKNKYLARIYV